MDATTFHCQKQHRNLPIEERIELIDASDLPTNERRTLIALVEAADHQQSIPHHLRHEPEWRRALGEPPWPSWFQHQYWPSLDTVAFHAGITTATARRHLRLLSARGVL